MTNAVYVGEIVSANKNQFRIHMIDVIVVYASKIFYHITNRAAHTTYRISFRKQANHSLEFFIDCEKYR